MDDAVFQNEPFYIAEWAILPCRMIHFDEQNGPFLSVKWAILEGEKM